MSEFIAWSTANAMIKDARRRQQVSTKELAELIGVSERTYLDKERGVSDWWLRELREISDRLGLILVFGTL